MYDSESNSGERKSAGLNQRGWESSGSEKKSVAVLCGAGIGSAMCMVAEKAPRGRRLRVFRSDRGMLEVEDE